MPAFHFRIHNGSNLHDESVYEFSDVAAVRAHALRYAGDVIAGEPELLADETEWRLDVLDAERRPVFALHLFVIETPRVRCADDGPSGS
jgi:hypothetical protein